MKLQNHKILKLARDPLGTQEWLEALNSETQKTPDHVLGPLLCNLVGDFQADYSASSHALSVLDHPSILLNSQGTIVADNSHAAILIGSVTGGTLKSLNLAEDTLRAIAKALRGLSAYGY